MEKVEVLADRLLQAITKDAGKAPVRIVVEPNGTIEVNCRAGFRDETHPRVYFLSKQDDGGRRG